MVRALRDKGWPSVDVEQITLRQEGRSIVVSVARDSVAECTGTLADAIGPSPTIVVSRRSVKARQRHLPGSLANTVHDSTLD
jgi:hypothetical protein